MSAASSRRAMLIEPSHVGRLRPLAREERQHYQAELRERAYRLAGAQTMDGRDRRLPPIINGVGVLLLVGELSNEGDYYGTSLIQFQEQLSTLVDESTVRRIVIYVDSPGGDYIGTPETAAAIAAVNKVKSVVSFTNGYMASGAFWCSSAAGSIVSTPSATGIGSIGALMVHSDWSGYYQSLGIANTIIRSPKGKADFNTLESLTDEVRDREQEHIADLAREFYAAVVRHRRGKMGLSDVVKTNAGVFHAREAKEIGLVDRIEPWPSLLARLQGEVKQDRLTRVESLCPSLRNALLAKMAERGELERDEPPTPPTADEIASRLAANLN
jgi:capsid assembly protease